MLKIFCYNMKFLNNIIKKRNIFPVKNKWICSYWKNVTLQKYSNILSCLEMKFYFVNIPKTRPPPLIRAPPPRFTPPPSPQINTHINVNSQNRPRNKYNFKIFVLTVRVQTHLYEWKYEKKIQTVNGSPSALPGK